MEPSSTLERIVPDALGEGATGAETLAFHVARYDFALRWIDRGTVLDLACGAGYGSAHVVTSRPDVQVIGGDIDRGAIRYARTKYRHPRIALVQLDGAASLRAGRFDVVVSLETLEHVPEPAQLFATFASLLRPGGVLVASAPVTPSVDANPHHRTDFTEASLLKLGRDARLQVIDLFRQVQPFQPIAIICRTEARTRDLRPALARYYLSHPSAAIRRAISVIRYGFTNRYLTVAWRK